jgi:SAM-dependent methyltransferase
MEARREDDHGAEHAASEAGSLGRRWRMAGRPTRVTRVTRVTESGTSRSTGAPVTTYYRRLLQGNGQVLDVGCGKGDYLDDRWIGVDYDVESLRGLPRVAQVDVSRGLPFRDGSFTGVLAKDLIEHLEDPLWLLADARRVAQPGARLVLVTPRAIPRAVWADYTHIRGFTRGALRALLTDAGWSIDRIYRMGGVPLAGRLGLVSVLPTVLRIPGVGHFFGTNWQVLAHRA